MKQKIIKVIILFFLLMALFTILSRVTYNLSIAEISAVTPTTEVFSPEASAQGTVVGRQEIPVAAQENQVVRTVYVSVGQNVEAGDVLYELDMTSLEENIRAKQLELQTIDLQIESAQSIAEAAEASRQLAQSQAENDYNRVAAEGTAAIEQAAMELQSAQEQYQNYLTHPELYPDQSEEALFMILEEKEQAYNAAVKSRDDNLYAAQKAIDSANIGTAKDTSVEQAQLTRQKLAEELKKLQGLYDIRGKITAPAKGMVTEIAVKAGGRTTGSGDILLADASSGTRLSVVFSEEMKEYIREGQQATVASGNGSGGKAPVTERVTVTSVLDNATAIDGNLTGSSGISADRGITVLVDLPSERFPIGSTATLKVETPTTQYETCVPTGALHLMQGDQYYVNVVEKRASVLGEEWTIRQVVVELLDKNEQYAAVQGITTEQEVVTESSRALEDGSRVKRKDL